MVNKDRLTKARRSWNMSRIRGKDTTPELVVRRLLHKLGYRFRLHVRIPVPASTLHTQLSAFFVRPDILLPKYKTALLVHGCFWHRHKGCKNCTTPTNHRAFWVKKFARNAARDKLQQRALRKLGWRLLIVWECETKKPQRLAKLTRRIALMTCERR